MSEWTTVKRSGGDKDGRTLKIGRTTWIFSEGIDRDATLESTTAQLEKHKKAWRQDSIRPEVHQIVSRLGVLQGEPITKAVCLALGSLSRDNLENRRRSMAQLAQFLDVVDYIGSNTGHDIAMYAQDPAFTDVDKQVLQSIQVNIIEYAGEVHSIGSAVHYFGPDAYVVDFFMDKGVQHVRELIEGKAKLLQSGLAWHLDHFEESNDTRADGAELRVLFEKSYQRYNFPKSASRDSFAYKGHQLMSYTAPEPAS